MSQAEVAEQLQRSGLRDVEAALPILADLFRCDAVMYLPTEGLFAEVVRRPGLMDAIQRECHVMVAGPTTLFTLLTAMRMGFRSCQGWCLVLRFLQAPAPAI